MDRLEEDPLAVPRAPMMGDEPVFVYQPDFLHRGHYEQLAVRVLHGDGVVVGIKTHERLRTRRSLCDASRLERLLRQWQESHRVMRASKAASADAIASA